MQFMIGDLASDEKTCLKDIKLYLIEIFLLNYFTVKLYWFHYLMIDFRKICYKECLSNLIHMNIVVNRIKCLEQKTILLF
jgi:hypothetical protein